MNLTTTSRQWLRLALFALTLGSSTQLLAQGFDNGSTGSDGAINITANTVLTSPANGIFNVTTLNVDAGKTLTFTKNTLNTPIQILATGDVTISGTVNVDATGPGDGSGSTVGGTGGPGGYDGGASGYINSGVSQPPGDGQGPGGGSATFTNSQTRSGAYSGTYGGKLLLPLVGGSGGAGASGNALYHGGGGGGAILISSNTKIVIASTGKVTANGGYNGYSGGSGSGGAVRLVSPRVYGTGRVEAQGAYTWAPGLIRIDSLYKVDPADNTQRLALVFDGNTTIGGNFVLTVPRTVSVSNVAGQAMSNSAPNSVLFPIGTAATNQTATVVVNGLSGAGNLKVSFAIIPASGAKTVVTKTVAYDMSGGSVPFNVSFTALTFPTNVVCQVQAWVDDAN